MDVSFWLPEAKEKHPQVVERTSGLKPWLQHHLREQRTVRQFRPTEARFRRIRRSSVVDQAILMLLMRDAKPASSKCGIDTLSHRPLKRLTPLTRIGVKSAEDLAYGKHFAHTYADNLMH
jgi:hypothetical protein